MDIFTFSFIEFLCWDFSFTAVCNFIGKKKFDHKVINWDLSNTYRSQKETNKTKQKTAETCNIVRNEWNEIDSTSALISDRVCPLYVIFCENVFVFTLMFPREKNNRTTTEKPTTRKRSIRQRHSHLSIAWDTNESFAKTDKHSMHEN